MWILSGLVLLAHTRQCNAGNGSMNACAAQFLAYANKPSHAPNHKHAKNPMPKGRHSAVMVQIHFIYWPCNVQALSYLQDVSIQWTEGLHKA